MPWGGNWLALNIYPDPALQALMHATRPFGLYAVVLLFLVWTSAWVNPALPRMLKHFVGFYSIVMLAAFAFEQIYYYRH